MTTTRTGLTFVSVLALALSFGACGDDDNGGGDPPDASNGGGTACAANFANCASFDDMTGAGSVSIAVSGFAYTPKCIRVSVGTQVTIEADGFHPLRAATCSPEDFIGGQVNASGTYTVDEAGVFGYYCTLHGSNTGGGMAGAIEVVE